MKYYIDKQTNKVKMVSNELMNISDKYYIKDINDNDYDGYEMYYINNKLNKTSICPEIIKEEKIKNIDKAITVKDLKNIIKELI